MTTLTLSSKAKKEAITTDTRIFSVAFRKKRKSNIVVLYSAANYSKHFFNHCFNSFNHWLHLCQEMQRSPLFIKVLPSIPSFPQVSTKTICKSPGLPSPFFKSPIFTFISKTHPYSKTRGRGRANWQVTFQSTRGELESLHLGSRSFSAHHGAHPSISQRDGHWAP